MGHLFQGSDSQINYRSIGLIFGIIAILMILSLDLFFTVGAAILFGVFLYGIARFLHQSLKIPYRLAIVLTLAAIGIFWTLFIYSQTNQVCGKARGRRAAELAPGQ
jgi:hypothetical protein